MGQVGSCGLHVWTPGVADWAGPVDIVVDAQYARLMNYMMKKPTCCTIRLKVVKRLVAVTNMQVMWGLSECSVLWGLRQRSGCVVMSVKPFLLMLGSGKSL